MFKGMQLLLPPGCWLITVERDIRSQSIMLAQSFEPEEDNLDTPEALKRGREVVVDVPPTPEGKETMPTVCGRCGCDMCDICENMKQCCVCTNKDFQDHEHALFLKEQEHHKSG